MWHSGSYYAVHHDRIGLQTSSSTRVAGNTAHVLFYILSCKLETNYKLALPSLNALDRRRGLPHAYLASCSVDVGLFLRQQPCIEPCNRLVKCLLFGEALTFLGVVGAQPKAMLDMAVQFELGPFQRRACFRRGISHRFQPQQRSVAPGSFGAPPPPRRTGGQ
jgi:hypothetical protein